MTRLKMTPTPTMMTPQENQPELANALGLSRGALYFKREDLYPLYGSHKGRSIPHMIDAYAARGIRQFAISSSGNGALTAALHINRLNHKEKTFTLAVFVGAHIDAEKLGALRGIEEQSGGTITIDQSSRPLQKLFATAKNPSVQSLRQSTNPAALDGYQTLADELLGIPDLQAVFIPSSSGTTAQALGTFLKKNPSINSAVEIHVVQTEQVHALIHDEKKSVEKIDRREAGGGKKALGKSATGNDRSIADAIVDSIGHRKNAVRDIIRESGGTGWIVSNAEIEATARLVKEKTGLTISPNSALSVAGLQKALETRAFSSAGKNILRGSIVCLITGN